MAMKPCEPVYGPVSVAALNINPVIEVIAKDHYGATMYYPRNSIARAMARIAGTKTLPQHVLCELCKIGFVVDVYNATYADSVPSLGKRVGFY